MKNRILIFGPIGDFGGREIEAGFIAQVLAEKNIVDIFSTSDISSKSQTLAFKGITHVYSLKKLVYKSSAIHKLITNIAYYKNRRKKHKTNYANNKISKFLFKYEVKAEQEILKTIADYDLIIICAQLSSKYVGKVIEFASRSNIKIIFRTTGTVRYSSSYDFIKDVDLFLHHSMSNADNLMKHCYHKFQIVDQCTFSEKQLLEIKPLDRKVSKFLILSRLAPEKGIEKAADYFLRNCGDSTLTIVGAGELKEQLKEKYHNTEQIIIKDFVSSSEIKAVYENHDCVVISSLEETGPLVGVEAMASARLLLSTKVGAMPERLESTLNNFWFDIDNETSFKESMNSILNLEVSEAYQISSDVRKKYTQCYTVESIGGLYMDIITKLLES